jgi:hypothetical protein
MWQKIVTELLTNPAFYVFEALNLVAALAVVFFVRAKPALREAAAKARVTLAELEAETKQAIAVAKADAKEVRIFVETAQAAAQSPEQIEAPTKVIVEGLLTNTDIKRESTLADIAPLGSLAGVASVEVQAPSIAFDLGKINAAPTPAQIAEITAPIFTQAAVLADANGSIAKSVGISFPTPTVAPVGPVGSVVGQTTTFDPASQPVVSTQLLSPSASPLDQSHADAPSPGNLPPLGAPGLTVAPVAPASPPNLTAA